MQDKIKILGKRVEKPIPMEELEGFFQLPVELRDKGIRVRKGVYRFRTYKESDEWMMNLLTEKN